MRQKTRLPDIPVMSNKVRANVMAEKDQRLTEGRWDVLLRVLNLNSAILRVAVG